MEFKEMISTFQNVFNTTAPPRIFFAPGRINLIGEHVDYNGGHVFPAALSKGTYAVGAARSDKKIRFYSINFPDKGIIECSTEQLDYHPTDDWANYPKGMMKLLNNAGFNIDTGADLLFYGNLPNGAGLSSSASIEMAAGALLKGLFDLNVETEQLIQIGQQVENNYIGVNSGIMDQFIIGKGKKDHAMLLDCRTNSYEYAPLKLNEYEILIINTNKERTLAGSKYNERRKECGEALADLQKELDISYLADVTPETFNSYEHLIKSEKNRQRARHVVYENARTIKALEKLRANELHHFGQLMNASHESLQNDYEVSGPELDVIVHTAWEQVGVLGARMTGAGFGGCAIAIVQKDKVENFKKNVDASYRNKIGYHPSFYTAKIAGGIEEIKED